MGLSSPTQSYYYAVWHTLTPPDAFLCPISISVWPTPMGRCAPEGDAISLGIKFLMYRFGRLVALVYIRRTLAGGG
jgi:hypothetical protein